MISTQIHPTAIVDASARLGTGVSIGPFAVIGPAVDIGDGCNIGAHAVLEGPLSLGAGNQVGPHVVLGRAPQDLSYNGEPTRLEIGADNTFREFFTAHRASTKEDGVTRIGSRNLLMAYCHVGHDCQLGNDIVIANATQLGGHIHVADQVFIAGLVGMHQFIRIGRLAMLGGGAMVPQDVAPFCTVAGDRASLRGMNSRGMQRAGLDSAARRAVRRAHDQFFRAGLPAQDALAAIEADTALQTPEVADFVSFIRGSQRGIVR